MTNPTHPIGSSLRTEIITFHCTQEEHDLLVSYARNFGVPVSEVARHALLQAIARHQGQHDDQNG